MKLEFVGPLTLCKLINYKKDNMNYIYVSTHNHARLINIISSKVTLSISIDKNKNKDNVLELKNQQFRKKQN